MLGDALNQVYDVWIINQHSTFSPKEELTYSEMSLSGAQRPYGRQLFDIIWKTYRDR